MRKNIKLVRLLKPPADLDQWVRWLNDKSVVSFSEQRFLKHTNKTQKKFLIKKIASKKSIIFKIVFNKEFVGVVELGNIKPIHRTCEVMYFIGKKDLWGQNLATIAIRLALVYAKKKLKIFKVSAGTYEKNIASQKVLLKNSFKEVGRMRKEFILKRKTNIRDNKIIFDKLL